MAQVRMINPRRSLIWKKHVYGPGDVFTMNAPETVEQQIIHYHEQMYEILKGKVAPVEDKLQPKRVRKNRQSLATTHRRRRK